jgi:NTE family protein
MTTIKNLAFKGGGVLGIAYAGAIKVMEDKGLLAGIEKVAGTSAGAITAALVSLNYSAADIYTKVKETKFSSFMDHKNPLRIVTKYGLYEGEALLNWVQGLVTDKGLAANATFADFKNRGCRDLHVFATDLNSQGLKEFSFAQTPNVVVAEAVRASMSIPLFFEGWQFSNNNPNNHIYVDGGMIYNYPLTIFDSNGTPNPETMGFFLTNISGSAASNALKYDEIFEYIKILFETMMDAQNINFKQDSDELSRTVQIDNLGISPTNFNITDAQEADLYQSGINYTTKFLTGKGV